MSGTGIRGVFTNAREQREIAAGDNIFTQGDAGGEMYGIVSGAVELVANGHAVVTLGEGDTFGELAIVSDAPRSLSAVATEDTVLAVIDERTFLFLVHETPTFALQVMRSMAATVRAHDLR
jgi:CRP/FNR family cyclic AMP-dependent transcriptional regulator